MFKKNSAFALLALLIIFSSCSSETEKTPVPYGTLPAERQVARQGVDMYAFLHFTVNNFTDKEWGYGDEKESVFNPLNFDADQIIGTIAKAGFKGAILTCKHHDGFCLWPSAYTEHSVKNSPWKNGKGDVVKEISDACKKYNIKFGVYLSPWDRNSAMYGKPEYTEYYKKQLRELLTNYGEIFEVWFDGANGGDGYYGGTRETRTIDKDNYYPWDSITNIVRTLQPNANIFSDAGPDLRWVGNESGYADDTCWATFTPEPEEGFKHAYAGNTKSSLAYKGTVHGAMWIPAEADVSIRPGWFYHATEDTSVKSLAKLADIYFHSAGNNAFLNLNIPPDRNGRIHPQDSLRLLEFKKWLDDGYNTNFIAGAEATVSLVNGKEKTSNKLTDGKLDTYQVVDSSGKTSYTIKLTKPGTVNCLLLQEYIALGQRVNGYTIEVQTGSEWKKVAGGVTIGARKLQRFASVEATAVRVTIDSAFATPVLSEIALYHFTEL